MVVNEHHAKVRAALQRLQEQRAAAELEYLETKWQLQRISEQARAARDRIDDELRQARKG